MPNERFSSGEPLRPGRWSLLGRARARFSSITTILAVFLVSLTFVLGLITLLDYFKFQSSMNDLADRRIRIIIDRVHHSLETAIDLGLNLRDIGAARTILDNTQAEDNRIKAIEIFSNEDRRVLFASNRASVGAPVDRDWLETQARAGDKVWRINRADHVFVGQRLDSALATGVGGVVLDYSLADVTARIEAMRGHLIELALLTVAVFSIVSLIAAALVTREFRRTIAGLSDAIASPGAAPPGSIPESLASSIESFKRTMVEAQGQLDSFEDALARAPERTPATETRPPGAAA